MKENHGLLTRRHVGSQDLLEDFSMDLTDNYRRMLGLDGTGQLPGVSAIGMPFDCFTDDDPATRCLLFPPPVFLTYAPTRIHTRVKGRLINATLVMNAFTILVMTPFMLCIYSFLAS